MTVETVTYISDFNSTYPAGADIRSEGDDHIRRIKAGIKATFPNVTGVVTASHTELSYSVGVTSAIQTQLNAKLNDTTDTFTGTLTINGNIVGAVDSSGFAAQFSNTSTTGGAGVYGLGLYGVYGTAGIAGGSGVIGLTNNNSIYALLGYNNTHALYTAGNAYVGGDLTATGNITAYSDRSLKTNLVQITDALSKVSKLNGYTFNWKEAPDGPRQVGMIAQEVQEVLPEAVIEVEGKLSLAYGNLAGLLVEAIKELQSRMEELEDLCRDH